MGVFTVHDALRAAAIDAGHELGLFETLAFPLSFDQLAEKARLRSTHRLLALVNALVALGALVCQGELLARGSIAPRSAMPLADGWGAIADVIRTDVPISIDDAEIARRYQRHLVTASAPAAREVAELLAPICANRRSKIGQDCVPQDRAADAFPVDRRTDTSAAHGVPNSRGSGVRVIDIGGGAGAYTRALLFADPRAQVTLVDSADVVELARAELLEFGERVAFVAADARKLEFGTSRERDVRGEARVTNDVFDVAVVANVLHLHGPNACAEICASAARAVVPSGVVAIVDLRRGTLEGEMFALNMAVYTDAGGVYTVERIGEWMRAAGLVEIEERRLASAPEMVVVLGRRPPDNEAL